ncbi:MAG: hypothetical protein ACKOUM_03695, partial [Sphingopyxis sp.]
MTATPIYHALHGATTSLVLESGGQGAPIWRYWGPRLPDAPGMGGPLAVFRPIASFSLEQPAEFSIFPGFGMGWFG